MAVLILLANTSPITVSCRRAGKSAPRRVGGVFPSFNGANRNSVRGEAKIIPIATSYLTAAEESAIQVAIANGVQIVCSGDILGNIPTLCSFDGVTSDIVPGTSPELWTMTFTMNEVNASTVLLKYAPGDTITGESFSRSTTAYQVSVFSVLDLKAINAKRDSHYVNGVRSTLLEDARTNNLSKSEQFDDAAWAKVAATISANAATCPDSVAVTADKLQEDNTNAQHYVVRNTLTTTASTNQAVSIFAKAADRTWVLFTTSDRAGTVRRSWVNLATGVSGTTDSGHTVRITPLSAGWYRIEIVFSSGTGASSVDWYTQVATADAVTTYLGTTGFGIYLWGAQHEQDKPFASSYIPTTTVAVTRGADSYSLPFTIPPQEMTVYTKHLELGTEVAANITGLYVLGGVVPNAGLYRATSNGLQGFLQTASVPANTSALIGSTAALNDTVETLFNIGGDGSTAATKTLNAGTESAASTTGYLTLPSAWSSTLFYPNGDGGYLNRGFVAFQSIKIVAGARSLSEMRGA